MLYWILLGGWVVIGMLLFRPMAGHYAYKMAKGRKPSSKQWDDAKFGSLCTVVVWPIVPIITLVIFLSCSMTFGAERQYLKKEKAEMERAKAKELARQFDQGEL
jgi:heme/copper-type cytochrome/quinol oxidase subunit 2